MAVYAIGDIQGCFQPLQKLLNSINYKSNCDSLWFCGDLVNRGPSSLDVLRFVSDLGDSTKIVLGNHDLHMLAIWSGTTSARASDHLEQVLLAPDCDELMNWLRSQPLIVRDDELKTVMFHAAIHPQWTIDEASSLASEVQDVLSGPDYADFFTQMYGDHPTGWSNDLAGMDRLRSITNVFTRLRYLTDDLHYALQSKLFPPQTGEIPWFDLTPARYLLPGYRYIFGHWSTLPVARYGQVYAIDGGCLWGGELVALRIDSTEPDWFKLDCEQSRRPAT